MKDTTEFILRAILLFLSFIHLIGTLWIGELTTILHNFISIILIMCMFLSALYSLKIFNKYFYRAILLVGIISASYLLYEAAITDNVYEPYFIEIILFLVLIVTSGVKTDSKKAL